MNKRVVVIYGMGGSIFDPKYGEAYLTERLKQAGFDVGASPYQHTDRQAIYDFLHGYNGFIAIVGDSLGAGCAPLFARDLHPHRVDYIAGFQPSVYDPVMHGTGEVSVPDNVVTAHCIRDPVWFDTLGLGYATWTADNPHKTKLTITEHRAQHPDDYGVAQDWVYEEVVKLAG